jgi:hypothetical protein
VKQSIVFLDFEASGLLGPTWPVEVGYASSCGCEDAFLLARQQEWSLAGWDRNAAQLHGISLDDLDERGLAPEAALGRLDRALEDKIVVSDAPDFDNFWLDRIAEAAGRPAGFRIADWESVLPSAQSREERAALIHSARARERQIHRAGADARVMRAVWRASWEKARAEWVV